MGDTKESLTEMEATCKEPHRESGKTGQEHASPACQPGLMSGSNKPLSSHSYVIAWPCLPPVASAGCWQSHHLRGLGCFQVFAAVCVECGHPLASRCFGPDFPAGRPLCAARQGTTGTPYSAGTPPPTRHPYLSFLQTGASRGGGVLWPLLRPLPPGHPAHGPTSPAREGH